MALGHHHRLAVRAESTHPVSARAPWRTSSSVYPLPWPEGEELHELPRQVFVGRLGGIGLSVKPMHHRGVGQHGVGERAEISERQAAQFLVLRRHVRRDPHFLRGGGKVVVPQQRQLLMNGLLDRYHSEKPPSRQLSHLLRQLAIEFFAGDRTSSLPGAPEQGQRRHRRRSCAEVRLRVCAQRSVDVVRPIFGSHGVDLCTGRPEPGPAQNASSCDPPIGLAGHGITVPGFSCVLISLCWGFDVLAVDSGNGVAAVHVIVRAWASRSLAARH